MNLGRYKDKPFLLLLEAYVLHAIGELPPATEQLAQRMAAKIFGQGEWQKRLQEEIGFDPGLGPQVKGLWEENKRIAKEKGADLVAAEFAQALVEANFAEIIEMSAPELEEGSDA